MISPKRCCLAEYSGPTNGKVYRHRRNGNTDKKAVNVGCSHSFPGGNKEPRTLGRTADA